MSVGEGFRKGCGCVFGGVAAVVVLLVGLSVAGRFVTLCPSCHGTGHCILCGGTGQGMLWGGCLNCGGKKYCPRCGGRGWMTK
jgi:hypothetical protein